MKNRGTGIIALLFVIAICLPGVAGATTYDLKTDWSDASNPNGAWSFYQGNVPLSHIANWAGLSGQNAWARAASGLGHVPAWLKATNNVSFAPFSTGDIIFHPTSSDHVTSSYDEGEGYAKWTSPIDGVITISGNVWTGQNGFGSSRSVDWGVYLNAAQLDHGTVDYSGNNNGRNFNIGTSYNVHVGDTIIFKGQTTSGYAYPWFVGVNLTIDATPTQSVPEPATMLLLGVGLMGLAGIRKKLS